MEKRSYAAIYQAKKLKEIKGNFTPNYISKMRDSVLVRIYLTCSKLYYHLSISAVSDQIFDLICKELLERLKSGKTLIAWEDELVCINPSALQAGTGYHIQNFPKTIENIAYEYSLLVA